MLPWRVRTTKDSPGLEYLLPFDYANFTYVSSSDGNPCLPSGLLSYGWHQPTYAVRGGGCDTVVCGCGCGCLAAR